MDNFKVNVIRDDFQSEKIQLPGATIGSSVEYPSAWFKANPKMKPPVNISQKV